MSRYQKIPHIKLIKGRILYKKGYVKFFDTVNHVTGRGAERRNGLRNYIAFIGYGGNISKASGNIKKLYITKIIEKKIFYKKGYIRFFDKVDLFAGRGDQIRNGFERYVSLLSRKISR